MQLKETAERILAVDRAAAMVEDILKQVQKLVHKHFQNVKFVINTTPKLSLCLLQCNQVSQPLSTCVYLGFDADLSPNVAARIRGPNVSHFHSICLPAQIHFKLHDKKEIR